MYDVSEQLKKLYEPSCGSSKRFSHRFTHIGTVTSNFLLLSITVRPIQFHFT